MFKRRPPVTGRLKDWNSDPTEYEMTAISPIPLTTKIPVPDKTSQFCSIINMIIKNRFAVVTFNFGQDSYQVVSVSSSGEDIVVYFADYGGMVWKTTVNQYKGFNIFRGV